MSHQKGEKATSAYKDAKPLLDILKSYSQMKAFNLLYTSGKRNLRQGHGNLMLAELVSGKLKMEHIKAF